jgi:hypothetical protein
MKKIVFAFIVSCVSLNSCAYTVLSKLECSTQHPEIALINFEIRKGPEAGAGKALLAEIIYENEESVILFNDFISQSSFDNLKSFEVSESGDLNENAALVNLEMKDKTSFKGKMAFNNSVIPLNCKKVK